MLGWIAGLGVLASYCIQFLSVFEFLGSGYFLLGYQRTAVFGFVLYSVSIFPWVGLFSSRVSADGGFRFRLYLPLEFSFGPVILSSNISGQWFSVHIWVRL